MKDHTRNNLFGRVENWFFVRHQLWNIAKNTQRCRSTFAQIFATHHKSDRDACHPPHSIRMQARSQQIHLQRRCDNFNPTYLCFFLSLLTESPQYSTLSAIWIQIKLITGFMRLDLNACCGHLHPKRISTGMSHVSNAFIHYSTTKMKTKLKTA